MKSLWGGLLYFKFYSADDGDAVGRELGKQAQGEEYVQNVY